VGLKDARNMVVSLDFGAEKRHFGHDLEQKTGSGGIRGLGNESCQVKACSSLSLPQVQIINWQQSLKGTSSSSLGPWNDGKLVKRCGFRCSGRRRLQLIEARNGIK